MSGWLRKLTGRATPDAAPVPRDPSPTFAADLPPAFETRLAVESPGAPGLDGAAALYSKWAARWQEF
jgi:hypothetical protein